MVPVEYSRFTLALIICVVRAIHSIADTINIRDEKWNSMPCSEYPMAETIAHCTQILSENSHCFSCPIINEFNYTYILNSETKCEASTGYVELFVIIISNAGNFNHRRVIRETWGMESLYESSAMSKIFLVARPESHNLMRMLTKENLENGDIVIVNLWETPKNSAAKVMMAIKWALDFCSNKSKYFLFTQDGTVQSIKNSLQFIRSGGKFGTCNFDAGLPEDLFLAFVLYNMQPIREAGSFWNVSYKEFPFSVYPSFPHQATYLLSIKTLQLLYAASYFTKPFWIDNVYLGMLVDKAAISMSDCQEVVNVDWISGIVLPLALSYGVTLEVDNISEIWQFLRQNGYA